MDKIYSRKRIHLPRMSILQIFSKKRKYAKEVKKIFLIIILIISIIILIKSSLNYINPMFDSLCNLKAKGIATRIVNREAKASLENVNYNDLITIVRDSNGNITMVKANVIAINTIASELTLEIQKSLENEKDTTVYIPMGSFFGGNMFYNMGPNIPIKLVSSGIVTTDFKSEFTTTGINQTIHKIYLYTICKVNIITPIKTISSEINNEILVAETVIVGPIPETYYNLEGMHSEDAIEVIN